MAKTEKPKLQHVLLAAVLFSLAACQTMDRLLKTEPRAGGAPPRYAAPEPERDARAADEGLPADPLARHMWARRQVDPTHPERSALYTTRDMTEEEKAEAHTLLSAALKHKPVSGGAAHTIPGMSPSAPAPQAPPARIADAPPQYAPLPATSSVTDIRIGRHPGKTRLVLDMDAKAPYIQSIDNNKRLLLIRLPQSAWRTTSNKVFENHELFQSYVVRALPDGGAVLALRLNRPARVLAAAPYPPAEGRGHRLVFDIASGY